MMNVPNEEIGFAKNSLDPSSSSSSPSIQQQNVQKCLKNLFQSPSLGIEQAFNIILKSLEEQRQESQKLLSDHTLLKEENLLLTETLKECEKRLKASEMRDIKLEERMESFDKESKDLRMTLKNSPGIGGKSVAMASDLVALQQEVRMMAFNLELDNVPTIAEAVDDIVQTKKFEGQKKEKAEEPTPPSSQLSNNSQQDTEEKAEEPPPPFSQLSINSQQDTEVNEKELADSSPNTNYPVNEMRSSENIRGSRVGKIRFNVQDTLAARLRRLEMDKENLKNQIISIKGMIENDNIDLIKRVASIETFLVGFDEANVDALPQELLPPTNHLTDSKSDIESDIENESISHPLTMLSATTDLLPKKSDADRPFEDSKSEIKDKSINKMEKTSKSSEACSLKNDFNIARVLDSDDETNQNHHDQTSLNESNEIDQPVHSFTGNLHESSDKRKTDTIKEDNKTIMQALEGGAEISQNQHDREFLNPSKEISHSANSPNGKVHESSNKSEADTVEGDFSIKKAFDSSAETSQTHSVQAIRNPSKAINQHSSTVEVEKSPNNSEVDATTSDIYAVQVLGSASEASKSDDGRAIESSSKEKDNLHRNSHKKTQKKQNIRSFSKRQSLFRHLEDQEYRIQDNLEDISSRLRTLEFLCNGDSSKGPLTPNCLASKDNVSRTGSEAIGEGDIINDNSDHETLRNSIYKMMVDIDSKVSKEFLYDELEKISVQSSMHLDKKEGIESVENGDNFANFKSHVQSQLLFLKENKANIETLNNTLSSSNDLFQQKLDTSLAEQDSKINNSISTLHLAVNECKESIRVIDSRLPSTISLPNTDLEERMKDAFESMESNLKEELTSRLQCLKQIEDNVERFASQLAEIPDQDQIKKMLGDLENVGIQHAENDTVHDIIENMKNELKEKMTKEQVLGLVRQILRGAKDLITRNATNDSSLMVGYRCIGCSNYHPQGVNKTIAPKVNHNKLPHGKGFSPSAFPHFKTVPGHTAKFSKGNAPAPVYHRRDTPSSFIRRSRTPSSLGLRRSRLRSSTRPISADK